MKSIFGKISVLTCGVMLAYTTTSCVKSNPSNPTPAATETQAVVTKATHTIKGTIFDKDGNKLEGATVTINGTNVTVSGNTFTISGLESNKQYVIMATKEGYVDGEGSTAIITIDDIYEVVNGVKIPVSQIAEASLYLTKEVKKTVQLGSSSDSQSISIENSAQDLTGDGTTPVGNTQDPSDESLNSEIVVTAETPALDTEEVEKVEEQLPEGKTVADVKIDLSNISTAASDETPAARRAAKTIIAGSALPDENGEYTFLTGVKLLTPFTIDLTKISSSLRISFSIVLPDEDMKKCLKLYRRLPNAGWKEVNATTTGNGIAAIDYSKDKEIFISLNILTSQDYALGVSIQEDEAVNVEGISFNELKVENTTSDVMSVPFVEYNVQSTGVVLTNQTKGAMVDYLRKVILRYYKIRSVAESKLETYQYNFSPALQLPVGAKLYLAGSQSKSVKTYTVKDSNVSFKAEEYEAAAVYPYAIAPEITPVDPSHGGGTND